MSELVVAKRILTSIETFLQKATKLKIFESLLFTYKMKDCLSVDERPDQILMLLKCLVEELNGVQIIDGFSLDVQLEDQNKDVPSLTAEETNTDVDYGIAETIDTCDDTELQKEQCVSEYFKCDSCNRDFTTIDKLSTHMLRCRKAIKSVRNKSNPPKLDTIPFYCCETCFGVSSSKEKFDRHVCGERRETNSTKDLSKQKLVTDIAELYGLNKYMCLVCTEEYRSVDRMNYHLPRCKRPPYACELCAELFTAMKDLYGHKKQNHNKEDAYFCDECNLRFKLRTSLHKHQTNKHEREQGPFVCDVDDCGAKFTKRIQLTNHKICKHRLEKKHLCQICGNKFCTKASLAVHVQIHKGERKFECSFCNKTFRQKEKLIYHNRTHTGERPHVCQICNKAFIRKSKLDDHVKRHKGEKPYPCNFCTNRYAANFDLKIHIKNKHSNTENQSTIDDAVNAEADNTDGSGFNVVNNDKSEINHCELVATTPSSSNISIDQLAVINQTQLAIPHTVFMTTLNGVPTIQYVQLSSIIN